MGRVLYPDRFDDFVPAVRADEVFEAVYDRPLYDDLVEIYGGLEPIDLT